MRLRVPIHDQLDVLIASQKPTAADNSQCGHADRSQVTIPNTPPPPSPVRSIMQRRLPLIAWSPAAEQLVLPGPSARLRLRLTAPSSGPGVPRTRPTCPVVVDGWELGEFDNWRPVRAGVHSAACLTGTFLAPLCNRPICEAIMRYCWGWLLPLLFPLPRRTALIHRLGIPCPGGKSVSIAAGYEDSSFTHANVVTQNVTDMSQRVTSLRKACQSMAAYAYCFRCSPSSITVFQKFVDLGGKSHLIIKNHPMSLKICKTFLP